MEEFVKRVLNYLGPKFVGSAIICMPVLVLTVVTVLGLSTYRDQPFSFLGLGVGPTGPRNIDPGALAPPIGSVIAFVGNATDLPSNWKICDGSLVTDQRSKLLYGKQVPDLSDNRFLMGIRDSGFEAISRSRGGKNEIPTSTHKHDGSTATRDISHSDWAPGQQFQRDGEQTFRHSHPVVIPESGAHNHDGENRPLYQGVLFIMRVW